MHAAWQVADGEAPSTYMAGAAGRDHGVNVQVRVVHSAPGVGVLLVHGEEVMPALHAHGAGPNHAVSAAGEQPNSVYLHAAAGDLHAVVSCALHFTLFSSALCDAPCDVRCWTLSQLCVFALLVCRCRRWPASLCPAHWSACWLLSQPYSTGTRIDKECEGV